MIFLMRPLLVLLFIAVFSLPVYGDEIDGKVLLKKGKVLLEKGNYEESISSLSAAVKEIPLLGDYALLWLSDAYHENGDYEESLKTVRILLKKYSHSPLVKKARFREIKEAEEVSEKNIQRLYKAFIKDYKDDEEIKYLYALWLKKADKEDKARSIFKDIYIEAGSFSDKALRKLRSADIGVKDLIERASNLMKAMNFRKAESVYRQALAKDDGRFEKEILRGLGLSLFRQKKYHKAADVYAKADSTYWQVRSLYRAGEDNAFNAALEKLRKSGNRMTGKVLIWVANDYRRDGKTEEAIKIFETIRKEYPSEAEDALWGTGWTYFRAGNYKRAVDTFSKLYRKYRDTRYLYWKARSLDEVREDASKLYSSLIKKNKDFYGIMACLQIEDAKDQYCTVKNKEFQSGTSKQMNTHIKPSKNNRIETLLELDFSDEALYELKYISRQPNSLEDIIYICSKFQELKEYKYLVRLAIKLPNKEEFSHFRYPLAYRDIVEGLSLKYELDPFLVFSVAREESRFDSHAKSVAGALGIMQIMPKTAYRLDRRLKLGIRCSYGILDVENNIHFGIYLLSNLIREFGSYSYSLAAYNAGVYRVRDWIGKGGYKSADEFIEDIPYKETRRYVKRVLTSYFEYKRIFSQKDDVIEISLENL